jgi:insertion element IS1 protein InsB
LLAEQRPNARAMGIYAKLSKANKEAVMSQSIWFRVIELNKSKIRAFAALYYWKKLVEIKFCCQSRAKKPFFCSLCFKVSGQMKCQYCNSYCQKAGKQKNGAQKLYCKACRKYQQTVYKNRAYEKRVSSMVVQLVCESVSIRGISRVLKIAINTVLRRIRRIAKDIVKPMIVLNQKELEVDEMRTYIGRKRNEYWLAYALNSATGEVVDFVVGKRSKSTLRPLINTLLLSGASKIRTDNLNIYQGLIPGKIHEHNAYCISHIERKNLSIRTHIKRLSRRTICFSRSVVLLESCMKIYFWGKDDRRSNENCSLKCRIER